MKVTADFPPESRFTVEPIPNKKGFCLARFYDNVEEYSQVMDGETTTGWQYDEYHLELRNSGSLKKDIEGNYDVYFKEAKRLAEQLTPEQVEETVKVLKADLKTSDEVAIELYEATLAQESINKAQDNALIQIYEILIEEGIVL